MSARMESVHTNGNGRFNTDLPDLEELYVWLQQFEDPPPAPKPTTYQRQINHGKFL